VYFRDYQATRCHIQEGCGFNISRREFQKSHDEGENFVSTRIRIKKVGVNT